MNKRCDEWADNISGIIQNWYHFWIDSSWISHVTYYLPRTRSHRNNKSFCGRHNCKHSLLTIFCIVNCNYNKKALNIRKLYAEKKLHIFHLQETHARHAQHSTKAIASTGVYEANALTTLILLWCQVHSLVDLIILNEIIRTSDGWCPGPGHCMIFHVTTLVILQSSFLTLCRVEIKSIYFSFVCCHCSWHPRGHQHDMLSLSMCVLLL